MERALFWSTIRADFPTVEEKPPVPEVHEDFETDGIPLGLQIRWEVTDAPPSPRLWAKSSDRTHTIQIQHDALMVNWERDPAASGNYWAYPKRRRDFGEKLANLDQFLRDERIGSLKPTTCFATYINHIEYAAAADYARALRQLVPGWTNETSDDWLPPVEQSNISLAFAMPEQQGRLHANIAPGVRRTDNKRILRFDMTARGQPRGETLDAILDWIDLGHEWIVRGFTSLTSPEMHSIWRRIQ